MSEMKYGELEIKEFDLDKHFEIWENRAKNRYKIKIELPEFSALCPRSGYPDYAKIYIEYIPDGYVVELKALKIYVNTFRERYISHEDSANEIYSAIYDRIKPHHLLVRADFFPRGNVHTVIEIDSNEQMEG